MSNLLSGSLCTAILEQSADAIIYADREGRIQLWNAAAERLFGFKAEEILGSRMDFMIPERLRSAHWSGYEKAMALGATKHSGKPMLTKAIHQSGIAVYVEMSFAVVIDPTLGMQGAVSIARETQPKKTS